ncbi:ArnT family glycosyltransferase [Teredinibacter waterburyi]|uniref:ArnT family glycosyltransferase n=1 Tax=Teredinibacter waterburyi TaxID=1500538 RepID=UPI00165F0EDA|nr:glycosyltransferase family 39 protein [Teredinibacter waterburyi]
MTRLPLSSTTGSPSSAAKFSPTAIFAVIVVLLTVYRMLVILQPHLSLFYDEAYYYHWSLNPDFGYYSKPPMVAWSIIVGTSLFGNGVFGIKVMASLLYAGSATAIFMTLQRIASGWQALLGGCVFLCIPMIGFNSVFITTDAPMIFCWSVTLYATVCALLDGRLWQWLLVGIATGFGMLSKYTMGALPLAIFLYLVFSSRHRPLLTTAGPWLAAIVSGLIFGLNIYWNYQNNWVALHHTQEISETGGDLFNVASLFEFWLTQIFIFGPVWSYLLVRGLIARFQSKSPSSSSLLETSELDKKSVTAIENQAEFIRLFIWATLIILAAISVQAFLSRAFANWAGPWMVGGALLLALCAPDIWQTASSSFKLKRWLITGAIIQLGALSLFYHWPVIQHIANVEPTRKNTPYYRIMAWPELGEQLKPYLTTYPNARLTSDSRDLLAYLGYFAEPGSFQFARWSPNPDNIRDYYDLKLNLRDFTGQESDDQETRLKAREFLFVTKEPFTAEFSAGFSSTKNLGVIKQAINSTESRRVYLTLATNFIGYP